LNDLPPFALRREFLPALLGAFFSLECCSSRGFNFGDRRARLLFSAPQAVQHSIINAIGTKKDRR
jgi:hypothetical protein